MKIAIIGSGISGLTAAYHLHPRHEVTVFEADNYIGGHTNTVQVEVGGERHAIDTGFIVFNERNYPNFSRLLGELGVARQPTSMSFSVRCERTGLEYNGTSINRLFAQRRNLFRPSFHRMIRDILRFNREAPTVRDASTDEMTVAEYVERFRYGKEFTEQYLVPLGASLWSCPPRTFREFPIRFVVEFLDNHAMLQVEGRPEWEVIQGGSFRYVEKLVEPFRNRILLNRPIVSVERRLGHVRLVDGKGREGRFDHVVLACHSDQALRLLADPSPVERELLAAFPYQLNRAILHFDESVLPRSRRAWASWNYRIPQDDPDRVSVTYNMNILQSLRSRFTFCVTLNEESRVQPDKVIQTFNYHHPIYTRQRGAAQQRHSELIGRNRTSFCGAYWGYGFHEDGVNSALAVCRSLEKELAA